VEPFFLGFHDGKAEPARPLSSFLQREIMGHSDVAPVRKTNPWNFDWERFYRLRDEDSAVSEQE